MHRDSHYMDRALSLAARGRGAAHPNPLVGAVLVKQGRIIGEGFHERCGAPHAEINALKNTAEPPSGATLYVNLEPCCHQGKTPPCTAALEQAGIARVVISIRDPNPKVNGLGIQHLRRAGIQVDVGVLEEKARELNRGFIHQMRHGYPWVTLKLALTIDGFIADHRRRSKWITNEKSRQEAHRLRAEHDAVLVGAGTVCADDPLLTVRAVHGRNPVRIVMDENLISPKHARIYHTEEAETVLITTAKNKTEEYAGQGVRILALEEMCGKRTGWLQVLKALYRELGILSILVEGGAGIAGGLMESGLIDELILMTGPKIIGTGLSPFGRMRVPLSDAGSWYIAQVQRYDNDLCIRYRREAAHVCSPES